MLCLKLLLIMKNSMAPLIISISIPKLNHKELGNSGA